MGSDRLRRHQVEATPTGAEAPIMTVAAWVDADGNTADIDEPGLLALYAQTAEGWHLLSAQAVHRASSADLHARRAFAYALRAAADDCRLLMVARMHGLSGALLDSLGFSLWQFDGPAASMLDTVASDVAQRVTRLATSAHGCGGRKNAAGEGPVPDLSDCFVHDGDDGYRLDLVATLARYPSLNSRQILLPFLTEHRFRQLVIQADHPPRWLDATLAALAFSVRMAADDHGVRLVIVPGLSTS